MKSILTDNEEQCFLCGRYGDLEWHHIFGGANRQNSTRYKLVVPLCHNCHNEPPDGVHFNEARMIDLRKQGQEAFEELYGHEAFMKIFGKNYL